MTALCNWNLFKRFRAGIFGLASFLGLGVAVVCIVVLVNGWNVYASHQKAAISFLLAVDVITSISLILMMTIFPLRPVADLIRVSVVFVFQIGLLIVFTLSAPNLPCLKSALVQSCKALNSIIIYSTCISVALTFIFIVVLIPMLRQPLPPPLPSLYHDVKHPTDRDDGSTLTYASWDKSPEKAAPTKELSPYFQNAYAESYYFKVQSKVNSPVRPPPPRLSQSPNFHNPFLTPESALMELTSHDSQDMSYLRPYTPMLPDSNALSSVSVRGSVSSFHSLSSHRKSSDSDILELQRAVLASQKAPYPEVKRRTSGDSTALLLPMRQTKELEPVVPLAPAITLTDADLIGPRNLGSTSPNSSADNRPPGEVKPLKIKRKVPQQLSLDNHLQSLEESNFSAVPRSPSPVSSPYSPNTFPVTPNSGALPSHPRLTMHFRELKLAKSARTLTLPS